MAEWCLSESGSDEAGDQQGELSDMGVVYLGNLKIPSSRVLDLMKVLIHSVLRFKLVIQA